MSERAKCICRAATGIYHTGIEMKITFLFYFFAAMPGWNSPPHMAFFIYVQRKVSIFIVNTVIDPLFVQEINEDIKILGNSNKSVL